MSRRLSLASPGSGTTKNQHRTRKANATYTYKHKYKYVLRRKIGRNKSSERSMEVNLPVLLGNYDKQTNQTSDRSTDRRTAHREESLPIRSKRHYQKKANCRHINNILPTCTRYSGTSWLYMAMCGICSINSARTTGS